MRAVRLCHTTSQWRGTAVELHDCCVRVSTARTLVQQHIDRTAWGSSAGTMSGSCALSLLLHTVSAPVSRSARLEDQLERADAGSWQIAGRGANTPTSFALRNGSISTLSALFVPVRQHDIDGALVFKDGESRKQIPRPKKHPDGAESRKVSTRRAARKGRILPALRILPERFTDFCEAKQISNRADHIPYALPWRKAEICGSFCFLDSADC